jgi:cytoplasmic iron level regulating protein YaaA (DUF328/UPF0246 family)
MVEEKESEPRYLLIIACSQRKRPDPGRLPAIERYDGVNFRVLQKAKRERYLPDNLDILILSAKYGLIEATTPIENYGLKMTKQRAMELQTEVSRDLDNYLSKTRYDEIFVNLGKAYLTTIAHSSQITELKEKYITPRLQK